MIVEYVFLMFAVIAFVVEIYNRNINAVIWVITSIIWWYLYITNNGAIGHHLIN